MSLISFIKKVKKIIVFFSYHHIIYSLVIGPMSSALSYLKAVKMHVDASRV